MSRVLYINEDRKGKMKKNVLNFLNSTQKQKPVMLKVNELFVDLEGEGRYQGLPTFFIRLTGCNLRCKWCDTKYAYFKGETMSVKEVTEKAKKISYENINITGGEPLAQRKAVIGLVKELKKAGKFVSVETNGSYPIKGIPADNISMDIKLPTSGETGKMLLSNLKDLKAKDQVKLVIGNAMDLKTATKLLNQYPTKALVIAQPVFGKITIAEIGKFVLKNALKWKVSVQLHKVVKAKKLMN